MKKMIKFLLKYTATIILFALVYKIFNRNMDLFSWCMGAFFEIIYFRWLVMIK